MTRTGIKLDLDVGDFISNAGRAKGAIATLADEMKKAEKEKRYEDYAKLSIQKAHLESQNFGFERDFKAMTLNPNFQTTTSNGTTILKMDAEYGQRLKGLNDSIKILTTKYEEQIQSGDFNSASDTFAELEKSQRERHKTIEQAAAPEGTQGKAMKNAMGALIFGQIANSINEGMKIWANSLDRSGIVSAYGSGDILGGRIAEKQRTANIVGGGAQTLLGTAGGIATALGAVPLGIGLTAAGAGVNTLAQALVSPEKNEATYAGLWEQRSADAMNLAALMGDPKQVREAFKIAADAASEFGFTAEEGMSAIKQATQQGLTGKEAIAAAKQVYQYERSTGADRGTLSSLANMSGRYSGVGDAIKAGWGGLGASGMTPGQFNEYLRAIQRSLEEGINKGFVRSSDQVVENFTMLAKIGGDDPTWKGEHGARRLSDMNAALANTTGLQSTGDILAFRAGRQIWGDNIPYNRIMEHTEEGLSGEKGTEFFNKTMKLFYEVEGGGEEGIVELIRQVYGQDYKSANKIYDEWLKGYKENGEGIQEADLKELIEKNKNAPLPDAKSPELEWAQVSARTANIVVQTGQIKFDEALPKLQEERKKAEEELNNVRNGKGPADISTLPPVEGVKVREKEFQEAAKNVGTGTGMMGGGFGTLTRAYKNLQEAQNTATQTTFGTGDVDRLRTRSTATVNSLFDTSLTLPQNQREENKQQQNKMLGTFGKALESGDEKQIQAVADALKFFDSASKETKEKWSEGGTSNSWANNTDVLELLRQLHSDILELNHTTQENGKLTISYE
jgi:hypothetical protein